MNKYNSIFTNPKFRFTIKYISLIFILIYLINCLTPLRLHVDTIRYFAIKDCIEIGCPPDSFGANDYLPYGYTGLLLALSKANILNSFTIVLINCICLFISIYLIKRLFGKSLNFYLFLLLLLLNWTVLKFTVHPLSELLYLLFSVSSLYFFNIFLKNKKTLYILLSLVFATFSFITRTIGITLFAAIFITLIWNYRIELFNLLRKNKIITISVALLFILGLLFSKELGLNHYTGVFSKQMSEGKTLTNTIKGHFIEWAEISYNTSVAKINTQLHTDLVMPFFLISGVLFFGIFIYLLVKKINKIPLAITLYIIFYSVLIFTWPFYDPRFWVPLIPFILVVFVQNLSTLKISRIRNLVLVPSFILYSIMGVLSVGFLTYTSLSKEKLAKTQANGVYRNEYETYFFGKPLSDTAKKIDTGILSLLKRHN